MGCVAEPGHTFRRVLPRRHLGLQRSRRGLPVLTFFSALTGVIVLLRLLKSRPTAALLVIALLVALSPARPAAAHYFGLIKMDDSVVDFGSDEDNQDHH